MIAPALALVAGFFFANRAQPKTRCEKKTMLGPRTGRTYDVEEFPDAGFMVLRMASGEGSAHGVFQHIAVKKPGDPRFSWRGGKGPSESLHGMCLDLGIVKEKAPDASAPSAPPRPVAVPNPSKKTA
jgi:hypothetical protein